jgi:Bacterial protein of unknown function (DUF899)
MFEGRPQLIIYHFMFDPQWEDGCRSCTAGTDELSAGFFEHLHTRDTSYAMVSRVPLAKLERWKAKKGWDVPRYSSFGTDFNYDFGVTVDESAAPSEYNVVGELDPRSAVTPERRPQAEDHPPSLKEADLIVGLLRAVPAERLVERTGSGQIGDAKRHKADALVHAKSLADPATSARR